MWAGHIDFGISFHVVSISEVALDSFAVEFWGWIRLVSTPKKIPEKGHFIHLLNEYKFTDVPRWVCNEKITKVFDERLCFNFFFRENEVCCYSSVCEFWTETEIPLKITELERPSTDSHPMKTTNYLPRTVLKCFLLFYYHYWGNLTNCGKVTCDGLASRPGEVKILLAASCYRNRDKLRQLLACLGSKASH